VAEGTDFFFYEHLTEFKKFYKIFQILRHIESRGRCIKH
jgi:hypothetical protein